MRRLAAAAALHTEAGIRRGDFGGPAGVKGVHYGEAVRLVTELMSRSTRPPWVEAFVRDWLVVSTSAKSWTAGAVLTGAEDLVDAGIRWLPNDPTMIALRGFHAERAMGPERLGPDEYLAFTPHYRSEAAVAAMFEGKPVPGMVTSPHGVFSRQAMRDAVSSYEDALRLAPTMAEVRVRLGFVQLMAGLTREAAASLQRALDDAQRNRKPVVAYWAALQLGRAREYQSEWDAALEAYAIAGRLNPRGTARRLARVTLLSKLGRPSLDEEWAGARDLLRDSEIRPGDRDPWMLYPHFAYWQLPTVLGQLKALVIGAGDS